VNVSIAKALGAGDADVLGAVLAARPDWFVTGDKRLRDAARKLGLNVTSAKELVRKLKI